MIINALPLIHAHTRVNCLLYGHATSDIRLHPIVLSAVELSTTFASENFEAVRVDTDDLNAHSHKCCKRLMASPANPIRSTAINPARQPALSFGHRIALRAGCDWQAGSIDKCLWVRSYLTPEMWSADLLNKRGKQDARRTLENTRSPPAAAGEIAADEFSFGNGVTDHSIKLTARFGRSIGR